MTGLIARVNPLVLVIVGLCALAGSPFVRSWPVALVTLGTYGLAAALFVPSWRYVLVCLAFTLVAGVSVAYSTWRLGGHDPALAVTAGLRIVVLAWPGSVAAGYIDPARLADYAGQRLRLPARGVVAFSAALQRFSHLAQTWTTLQRTRRARGLRTRPGPLAFALLVDAMRGATRSAVAMDARGFASARRRTWLVPAPWTGLDSAAVAVAVTLAALPALLSRLL
ncbi:MAG: energy-coupling factor transporter transmembrane component T [Aeromicrobium sp.]|uniref:energy-coupling factor transporter transmembrane component T family protein n=1 Tax=Aeromicrobium sp. TaxID=1871063 RepID=UPI0039E68083